MIDQYPPANGVLTSLIWRKTAAGGETSLSGYDNASQALSYTPGQEQVYLNGILLVRGDDYTATNGTSITGLAALSASDFVQVNCYNNFSVASTPATSITGTIANNQLANSAITINGTATSLGGTYTNASASTSTAGIVQLTDSTSSTSTTTAATPNSVKSAYDLANGAIPKSLTTTTGDIIYASGANTPARLGIGSTNQVLTVSGGVPSWATPSSGGLVKIGYYSFSGVTTYDISSVFSQTYDHYLLIGDERSSSGGGLAFQLMASGTPHTQYYNFAKSAVDYGGTHYPEGASNAARAIIANSNSGGERGYFHCVLWNPYNAVPTHYWSQHTTNAGASRRQGWFAGIHDVGASYNGIRLLNSTASNIAGNVTIYGYAL